MQVTPPLQEATVVEKLIVEWKMNEVSAAATFWLAWVKLTALDTPYESWQQDIAMMRLKVNDMEQSHLLSPLCVIDLSSLFINFERWVLTTSYDEVIIKMFSCIPVHHCSLIKMYTLLLSWEQTNVLIPFLPWADVGNERSIVSHVWAAVACLSCGAVSDSAGVCRCWNDAVELEGKIKDCSWAGSTALMMAVFISSSTQSTCVMASKQPPL